jgi:hypothetical protein
MKYSKEKIGNLFIVFFALISIVSFIVVPPIAQDVMYHQFSDRNTYLNIPNALNVLSNFFFLFVGCIGLTQVLTNSKLSIVKENIYAYIILFLGVALVSFGSGYYHLNPNNATLVWDRLPMTIAFMGLISIIISEFISIKIGKILLFPLLLVGVLSVVYWYLTEMSGNGDLRPYVIVQFLPVVAIPIILCTYTSRFKKVNHYWWLVATYILAKIFEHFDYVIFEHLVLISGHSLKHISAAIGVFIVIKGYQTNRPSHFI